MIPLANLFFLRLKVEHFSFYKFFFKTCFWFPYLGLAAAFTICGSDIETFSFSTALGGDIFARLIEVIFYFS
jgi:hypothetical protein